MSGSLKRRAKRQAKRTGKSGAVFAAPYQPGRMEQYYNNVTRKHSSGMALCMYYFFGIKMHDLYGFGAKRLSRLFNAVDEAMSGFSTGDFDANVLTQELYEKTGIDYRG